MQLKIKFCLRLHLDLEKTTLWSISNRLLILKFDATTMMWTFVFAVFNVVCAVVGDVRNSQDDLPATAALLAQNEVIRRK